MATPPPPPSSATAGNSNAHGSHPVVTPHTAASATPPFRLVRLARLARRVFTTDESLVAAVEVAHFGPAPLAPTVPTWHLVADDGRVVARGQLGPQTIPVDHATVLGSVSVSLRQLPAPARSRFLVALAAPPFENDGHVWVYPPKTATPPAPAHVLVTGELAAAALAALNAGGNVRLSIPPTRLRNHAPAHVALGFSRIFWNTAWTRGQPPTTLGILCDPRHPAFADFPTAFHRNWPWSYLVSRATPLRLDGLPAATRPIVQVSADGFTARKLGLVWEARVGGGRLVVCRLGLTDAAGHNPVARQLRTRLLRSMAGNRLAPSVDISVASLAQLITP